MRLDSHQHFWSYSEREYDWIDERMSRIRRDFAPSDLEPILRRNGIDGSIAVQVRQTLEETEWLLDLAQSHPFIAGVVGWVDLCSPEVRSQLARFAGRGKLVGLRHVVQAEREDRFLLRPDFQRGVDMLLEVGLAYDILIYPRHLPAAIEFARRFAGHSLVLDHLAKPDIRGGEIRSWERHLRELQSDSARVDADRPGAAQPRRRDHPEERVRVVGRVERERVVGGRVDEEPHDVAALGLPHLIGERAEEEQIEIRSLDRAGEQRAHRSPHRLVECSTPS